MSDMTRDFRTGDASDTDARCADWWRTGVAFPVTGAERAEAVTVDGAEWLASASTFPRSVRALWTARPGTPSVLPCGTAFDVVDLPGLFGRRVLERLWAAGPGCGPVAVHRGRIWLFAAPGTAGRLPALLAWEEWAHRVPPMVCHGVGDAVTVPPLIPDPSGAEGTSVGPRWLVAPDVRHPWLPSAGVLLWAMVRTARPRGALDAEGADADGYDGVASRYDGHRTGRYDDGGTGPYPAAPVPYGTGAADPYGARTTSPYRSGGPAGHGGGPVAGAGPTCGDGGPRDGFDG
jgi:Bifunctional DNA primase/polymerase, N-terminal